jgi:GT2 family glycosyltransferase
MDRPLGIADPLRADPPADRLTLSVCIVTYERPAYLARCLRALNRHRDGIDEIIVVDASSRSDAEGVAEVDPRVRYVHAPHLAGWMTRSRNEALRWATGDILAFIDDDVVVREEWATALHAAFADPSLAAAAGRTCNGLVGEETYDRPIGRLLDDGELTEGFASRPEGPVEVDHGIGANMIFRRTVLAELGGFRDDYPGTALREDTDAFLRVRALGGRVLFLPDAVVDHLPAPHVTGERFDTRYKLYRRRNHVVMLARHGGIASPLLRRWIARELRQVRAAEGASAKVRRLLVTLAGVGWGVAALPGDARWRSLPRRRQDAAGRALRDALTTR